MKNFGYRFFKVILKPIYKFYYNPKIYNSSVLDEVEGPMVVVGNHKHVMDQNNVIISTKKVMTYMAKKEYWDSWKTRWFFNMVGCIPVNRSIKDDSASSRALEVLKSGGNIGLFPEGTRNKTKEKLLPFKFGAVSMAKKTDSTLVPFAVVGDYKFRSKNLKIKFGLPIKVGDMTLEEANNKLYNEISNLMDELNNIIE